MGDDSLLHSFVWEWMLYLEERGHYVHPPGPARTFLRSRNGAGKSYLWVLLCARGPDRRLTAAERKHMQEHILDSETEGEEAYLVVRFELPAAKVLIIPLAKALEEKRLVSDKGGIPWEQ